jgi:hypothetical protein
MFNQRMITICAGCSKITLLSNGILRLFFVNQALNLDALKAEQPSGIRLTGLNVDAKLSCHPFIRDLPAGSCDCNYLEGVCNVAP